MALRHLVAGYDMGMAAGKFSGPHGHAAVPAHVAVYDGNKVTADDLRLEHEAGASKPLLIALDPGGSRSYWVGRGAFDWGDAQDARDLERLTDVPEARAAFYATVTRYIHRFGPIDVPVCLVAGVPFDAVSGDKGEANKRAIETWLTGPHSWYVGKQRKPYSIHVSAARVTRQGKGALYYYALDAAGKLIPARVPELKGEVGVVSLGFRTAELEIFRNYAPIPNRAGNAPVGVHRLVELAKRQERRHYKLGELDDLLRSGSLDVSAAKSAWFNDLRALVENVWDEAWPRLTRILVVGGGAYHAQEWLTRTFSGRCVVVEDPVMAISHGLRRIGLQVFGTEEVSAASTEMTPVLAPTADVTGTQAVAASDGTTR